MVDLSDKEIRDRVNDLIIRIYSFKIEDILPECCRSLRTIIPFDRSFTGFNDQSDRAGTTFNYQSIDTDNELLALYANHYSKIDYLSWWYNQRLPMTTRNTDLIRPEVIEQSRIHQEWESRMGVFYDATACIAANDILYGTISLMRSKEHGNFTNHEMEIFDEVNNHLCNVFRLSYPNGVKRSMMGPDADPLVAIFAFTPREWEIVRLLMQGLSRAEIADKLSISKNTVKRHVANIYIKMDVSNARQFFSVINRASNSVRNYGTALKEQGEFTDDGVDTKADNYTK